MYPWSFTKEKVKAVADKAGVAMDDKEFHCKGEFHGLNQGRPNESDIADAISFVQQYKGWKGQKTADLCHIENK